MKQEQPLSKHERRLAIVNEVAKVTRNLNIIHQVIEDETLDGRTIHLQGKPLLNFSSCSYLGLELDERVKSGATEAIQKYGTQFSSSRAYLSVALYREAESLLAKIFGAPVIVGPSVTLCHQSNIPVLIGDQDAVILDYQVHACVQSSIKLLEERKVHVEIIRHNNMELLEERIQNLSSQYNKIWYMADGVYSMLGDLAPMSILHDLLNKYEKFHLYIDDAHGMSWAGEHGAGYVKSQLWHHDKMFLVTSLNKSFAAAGGVMVFPNETMKNLVRNCGPTMIFSGPVQPPMLGAAIASAKIHLSNEIYSLQNDLQKRIIFFNKKAIDLNLPLINESCSPIFFIGVGKPEAGYAMTRKLIDRGFFVNLSVFPSVAISQTGLRIPVNLHHTVEDIEHLLNVIAQELPAVLDRFSIDEQQIRKAFKINKKAAVLSEAELIESR